MGDLLGASSHLRFEGSLGITGLADIHLQPSVGWYWPSNSLAGCSLVNPCPIASSLAENVYYGARSFRKVLVVQIGMPLQLDS